MTDTPVQIKELKEGSYVTIDGEPCKVVDIAKSKPGKHGAAKVRLDAIGIFDNKRRSLMKPASEDVPQPIIEKKRGQVISVSGDIVQLMDLTDYAVMDASIPEEFRGKLESGMEVTYWKYENRVLIKELR